MINPGTHLMGFLCHHDWWLSEPSVIIGIFWADKLHRRSLSVYSVPPDLSFIKITDTGTRNVFQSDFCIHLMIPLGFVTHNVSRVMWRVCETQELIKQAVRFHQREMRLCEDRKWRWTVSPQQPVYKTEYPGCHLSCLTPSGQTRLIHPPTLFFLDGIDQCKWGKMCVRLPMSVRLLHLHHVHVFPPVKYFDSLIAVWQPALSGF